MTPEHLTNEELIYRYFYDGGDSPVDHARMAVEIQNRLLNSIPKPVVQLVSGPSSGGYTYTINGREFWTDLDGCDAEFWGAIGVQGVAP